MNDLLCLAVNPWVMVVYPRVFSTNGRCVAVGGSCGMEEHRLLSDSPCYWHLRYPMSLFTDSVLISIGFMCK